VVSSQDIHLDERHMMSESPEILSTKVEIVKLSKLSPHPENPRRGTVGVIAESLLEHGQFRPLVVQRSTGYVLGGNHTLAAALQTGMTEIAVTYLDVDDSEARRILLVDNRTSDLGTYDNAGLLRLLQETKDDYGDLIGTGYDSAMLSDLNAMSEESGPIILGEMSIGQTAKEREDEYFNRAIRTIVIDVTISEYEWWITTTAKAREILGVEDNADLVLRLVSQLAEVPLPE